MVVAINYIREIASYIRDYGVDVPEIIVVLFLLLPYAFVVHVSSQAGRLRTSYKRIKY